MTRLIGRRFAWGVIVAGIAAGAFAGAGGGSRAWADEAPAPPRRAPADDGSHSSLGLEFGPGGVISAYNRNAGPSGVLVYGSLRAGYEIKEHWIAELVLRQWWPPSNHATMLGIGARWEPAVVSFGRWFVDLALGPVSTASAWTFGYDLGGGFEFDFPDVAGFSLGPYFRYGSVVNPDHASSNDGRGWTLGASFTYDFGRAASAPASAPEHRRATSPYHLTIPDTDGDGVADDEDQCRDVPQGKHPDPYRLGCPEGDEDGDGVPDADDACPTEPVGDKADPRRPGCPFVDTDGDGIVDADDACPKKAGKPSDDPSRNGCPPGKRRGVVDDDDQPPPADNSAPKPAHKRHH